MKELVKVFIAQSASLNSKGNTEGEWSIIGVFYCEHTAKVFIAKEMIARVRMVLGIPASIPVTEFNDMDINATGMLGDTDFKTLVALQGKLDKQEDNGFPGVIAIDNFYKLVVEEHPILSRENII
jgi:hypothetical protein